MSHPSLVHEPPARRLPWPHPWDLLAALSLLLLWVVGLGDAPLFDADEGTYAAASLDWRFGDGRAHNTLDGAPRADPPILVQGLQAASRSLLGDTEAAVRLPSALCAWAWSLALAAFAAARWGRATGWLAAAVLATSMGPLLIGRAATADALLQLLLTLTLLDLWRWLDGGGRQPLRRAFLWAGLGLPATGPVALLVPAGAVAAYLLPQGRAGLRRLAEGLTDRVAWLVLLAVALPWPAYAWARHGQAFVDGFLMRHGVERSTQALDGLGSPFALTLVLLPVLLLPWTPVLLRSAVREPLARYLWGWCGFVLLVWPLAPAGPTHVALLGLTPLALLVSWRLGQGPLPRAAAASVLALCALLVLLGAASVAGARWAVDSGRLAAFWTDRLQAALDLPGPASGGAVWLLFALGLIAVGLRRRAHVPAGWPVAAALISCLWWTLQVLPWWAHTLQGPVRTLAWQAREKGWTLVQWHVHQPSAAFYRGQAVPYRAPLPGEVALLRSDRLAQAEAQLRTPLQVLASAPGFMLVRPGAAAP